MENVSSALFKRNNLFFVLCVFNYVFISVRTVIGCRYHLDYGLVIICSSENEGRANIVAALEQCRVAAPPCPSPDDLKSYLKHQLRAPSPQQGYIGSSKIRWTAAGCLDPERLLFFYSFVTV